MISPNVGRDSSLPSLQHAVLHHNFVVYFHKHALASVPEGRLAVAVARAGARDEREAGATHDRRNGR
jgi:hypothetical protein